MFRAHEDPLVEVISALIETKISVRQIVDMAGCPIPSIIRVPIKVRWWVVSISEIVLKTNAK